MVKYMYVQFVFRKPILYISDWKQVNLIAVFYTRLSMVQ